MKSLAFIILSGLAFVTAFGNDTTVVTLDTLTMVHPTRPVNHPGMAVVTDVTVKPECPQLPTRPVYHPGVAVVTDKKPGCTTRPKIPIYHPSMAAVADVVKPECSKIPGYHPGMAVVTDMFGCPTIPRLPTRSLYRPSVAVVTDVTVKPGCSKLPTRPVYHPGMAVVTDKPRCTTRPKLPVYHPSIAVFTDTAVKPECSKIPGYRPGMAVATDKFGCPTIPRLPTRSIYHPADISFSTPDVAQPTGHPDARKRDTEPDINAKIAYVCSTSNTSPLFSDAIKAAGLAAENISTEDNQGCKEVSASGTAAISVCTGLGRLVQHGHFEALIEKCQLEIDGVLRVGGSVRLDGGGGKAVAVVYRRS